MILKLKITPRDIVKFGLKHDRPVPTAHAREALERIRLFCTSELEKVRGRAISRGLDLARLRNVINERSPHK
jgi:hypothetical protein